MIRKSKEVLRTPYKNWSPFWIKAFIIAMLPGYVIVGIVHGLLEVIPEWWEEVKTEYY